jgi:DNA-binding Lrp family transcriptional regulator
VPDLDMPKLESVKTSQLDAVDRQLLHALQVSPRASFRLLGDVIGVSDQTIGRRYRRLTQVIDLRVHGAVNGQRAGWVDWLVRIQVAPGSGERIATALARRSDTRWVRLFSGGAEINCTLQARTPDQPTALFLRGLPGSRHVTNVTAHSILHVFSPVEFGAYTGALSGAQVAALREEAASETGSSAELAAGPGRGSLASEAPAEREGDVPLLRTEDEPLLTALSRDGRATVSELAAATHWHESTVRRRIAELQRVGVLYFDIDVDDYLVLGARSHVMMWLTAEPAHLDAAGRALALLPEVPFAAATTGPTNLVASGVFRDPAELYAFLTTRLTGIPGLRSVETAPVIGTVKRAGEREVVPGIRRDGDLLPTALVTD